MGETGNSDTDNDLGVMHKTGGNKVSIHTHTHTHIHMRLNLYTCENVHG